MQVNVAESDKNGLVVVNRHIGHRIRFRRTQLSLTQTQLSELIGTSYQQVQKCENGTNQIAANKMFFIAQALGVEVGYFYEDLVLENAAVIKAGDRFDLENFAKLDAPVKRTLLDLLALISQSKTDH